MWEFALGGHTIRPYIDPIPHPMLPVEQVEFMRPNPAHFSLLRVCRQIYAESAIFSHVLSTFSFECDYHVGRWVKDMTPHDLVLARNVRALRFGTLRLQESLLDGLPGLERMEVHLVAVNHANDTYYYGTLALRYQGAYRKGHGIDVDTKYSCIYYWGYQRASGHEDARCGHCEEHEVP